MGEFQPEAQPIAGLARDVHVVQKLHIDHDHAGALTVLATPALHVEREPTRPHSQVGFDGY